MVAVITGIIGLVLIGFHRHWDDDPLTGMASMFAWIIFAAAGWDYSAGDPTDIYFYLFIFGVAMAIAMLLSSLGFSATLQKFIEEKKEELAKKPERGIDKLDEMRERQGLRKLNR